MKIACDIDGTLANVLPFLHLLPQNWEEYFKHTNEFEPIEPNVQLLQVLLNNGHQIAFVTGRPESNRELTEIWLRRNFTNLHSNSILLMRKNDDNREGCEIKLEFFKDFHPELIIDDEPAVIEIAKKHSYCTMQVHGYRDGDSDGIPFDNKPILRKKFSFKEEAVGFQSPEQTLMILTYELGKLIEYGLKAKIYGETGYYCIENQKKEMSDLISMARYYCELRNWEYEELTKLGEFAYLERMEDIKRYGKKEKIG